MHEIQHRRQRGDRHHPPEIADVAPSQARGVAVEHRQQHRQGQGARGEPPVTRPVHPASQERGRQREQQQRACREQAAGHRLPFAERYGRHANEGELRREPQRQEQVGAHRRQEIGRRLHEPGHVGDGHLVVIAEIQRRPEPGDVVGHQRQHHDQGGDDDGGRRSQGPSRGQGAAFQPLQQRGDLRPEDREAQQSGQRERGPASEIRRDACRAGGEMAQR